MDQDTEELRRDIEDTRSGMSDTLDAIEDRVSPGRMMQRRKNRATASLHSIRDRVMGTAEDAQHGLTGAAQGATDTIKHTPETVIGGTQGSPMVAGAIALGVGFLVAAAFPPSDAEKRASVKVMETLEPAKEQLVESARTVADNLKEPALEATEEIKAAAGEGVASVDTARHAVDDTKSQASDSMHAVTNGETGRPAS